jgi:hypothetical protein
MTFLAMTTPSIQSLEINDTVLTVHLLDGRTIIVPIAWYPRLSHARASDKQKWEFIGQGHGVHWPLIDEDISVENILMGSPSGESARSFQQWLDWYHSQLTEAQ